MDFNADGILSVSSWPDGGTLSDACPSVPFDVPISDEALADLRWYLEDYLVLPSAVYADRGRRIERLIPGWGVAMFDAVFRQGAARDVYLGMNCPALMIRSASPRLLALPWELLRDPARSEPLALRLPAVSRSLPSTFEPLPLRVPGGTLKVLMIIARPGGERDVGYQMIARPLLERLGAVRGRVELTVLRPPTAHALTTILAEQQFHVVHFDGHGHSGTSAFSDQPAGADEGVLVFEKPSGGPDAVSATSVAEILNKANIPVVVLNACQSGAIGKDAEAAVATRLLVGGTASVVAMAYSVHAVAAAEFMAAFYERLFAGDPVSIAVTAGRQRMFRSNLRPSRVGDLPLADWIIPVHYLHRDVSFPQAATTRTRPTSLDAELTQMRSGERPTPGSGDLDPDGEYVERDWFICQLESSMRMHSVVLLHGAAGTGKTELAKSFGRWWADTDGVDEPEHVFFHSFQPSLANISLDSVIGQVGRRLYDTDFDQLRPSEHRAAVERALMSKRMLLIWDNFESVLSMPAEQLHTDDDPFELRSFLLWLADHSQSTVLITSRNPEDWLGDICRIRVAGLASGIQRG